MAGRRTRAIVLFGDVVESRSTERSTAWLRSLRDELEAAYPPADLLAPWEFTQGDELQGLLRLGADPLAAVERGWLRDDRLPMRWVIVVGEVAPGQGPATQRTGPAFVRARELIGFARRRRERLVARTGDRRIDQLLDGTTPAFARLLAELTDRQRDVARLLIVDRLRQSEAAKRLNIKAPTVSVAAERAGVREIAGLGDAIRRLIQIGIEETGAVRPPAEPAFPAAPGSPA